jgi:MFS family permease
MSKQFAPPKIILNRIRQSFALLVTGGDWAYALPVETQRNLRRFFYDGLFAAASDNIYLTYLTLYVLALGATRAQIGLMSSLSNLVAALLLLPGAMLVEHFRKRKEITVIFGAGIARLMFLLLAVAPFMLIGQGLVLAVITFSVVRDGFANLAFPAWVSMTADIVPMEGRGRYFGSRNFVMGIAGMLTILVIGELITRLGQPGGYQLALGLAFALGITSTYYFSRLHEPPPSAPPTRISFAPSALWRDLRSHSSFLTLTLTAALWNFSLNIAGPFFSVYMVQNLKGTATQVGILSVVGSVSTLLFQRPLGKLADRWGAHRLQLICGLLIPILPVCWIFTRSIWHLIPINIGSGILWGAYGLASFNLLLELTPDEQRARYTAIYQIIIMVALAAGAALGGLLITKWGYIAIFLGSGIGRLVAALLFARFVHRPAPVTEPPLLNSSPAP